MTKLALLSDLHGTLPPTESLPPADYYVIAGDICPQFVPDPEKNRRKQSQWLQRVFTEWLYYLPTDNIVGIAGNKDHAFEKSFMVPPMRPLTYLQDDFEEVDGLSFYGSPWGIYKDYHAFQATDAELDYRATQIPFQTDVLVLHMPPPVASGTWEGDYALADRLLGARPKLVVCGHIHEARGVYRHGHIPVVNAAMSDITDELIHYPILWDLEAGKEIKYEYSS